MLYQKDIEKIKKDIEDFFEKMTFDVKIESVSQKDWAVSVDLKTDNPQILIGEKGQTLIDLQQLLSAIIKRKITSQEPFFLNLDINNYKKKKIEYLKEMAQALADEVALTKKQKWLPPMPSYERRIIHLELAERRDVVTESFGQEPDRKIAIKPYS